MQKCLVGGILAGFVLFLWSAFSWTVLPWHNATLHQFTDENAVSEVMIANAPQSGIYLSPHMQTEQTIMQKPMLFASVKKEGMPSSMVLPMLMSLLYQIIAALLVGWLLSKTIGLRYFGRVWFVVVFALAASIIAHAPYWTWFAFDTHYTLVSIADLIFAWFLAGLVLAKFCKPARYT